jgi:hypothetical protein
MKKMKRISLLTALALGVTSIASANVTFQTNFFRGHDVDFRTNLFRDCNLKTGVSLEAGSTEEGRDANREKVDVFSIYAPTQASVAAFDGPVGSNATAIAAKARLLPGGRATDDGTQGHFTIKGKYDEKAVTLWTKGKLPLKEAPGTWYVSGYLPIKSVSVNNLAWTDLSSTTLPGYEIVRANITSHLAATFKDLGDLSIGNWSGSGIGDCTICVGWYDTFAQDREALKSARVQATVGCSIPTAKIRDEDEAFSIALGNNGAWGIPVSLGLDLEFAYGFEAGINVDFLNLFDKKHDRRLKTQAKQTDFLLLEKGEATKKHGTMWQFNLYGKANEIVNGLSVSVDYRFAKRDEDTLYPTSDSFSSETVNTSEMLKEWSSHDIIVQGSYEFAIGGKDRKVTPLMSAFYKVPLTGKRLVAAHTYGGQLSFTF